MASHFNDLPKEIVHEIFKRVPASDAYASVSRINTDWNRALSACLPKPTFKCSFIQIGGKEFGISLRFAELDCMGGEVLCIGLHMDKDLMVDRGMSLDGSNKLYREFVVNRDLSTDNISWGEISTIDYPISRKYVLARAQEMHNILERYEAPSLTITSLTGKRLINAFIVGKHYQKHVETVTLEYCIFYAVPKDHFIQYFARKKRLSTLKINHSQNIGRQCISPREFFDKIVQNYLSINEMSSLKLHFEPEPEEEEFALTLGKLCIKEPNNLWLLSLWNSTINQKCPPYSPHESTELVSLVMEKIKRWVRDPNRKNFVIRSNLLLTDELIDCLQREKERLNIMAKPEAVKLNRSYVRTPISEVEINDDWVTCLERISVYCGVSRAAIYGFRPDGPWDNWAIELQIF